jgi:hypothetical protein
MKPKHTKEDIREFILKGNSFGNYWFYLRGLDIYLRRGWHSLPGLDVHFMVDMPNITASEPGSGAFTDVLEFIESLVRSECPGIFGTFIENVIEERFQAFLERRGYIKIPSVTEWPPSYYKVINPDTAKPLQRVKNYV